FVVDVTALYLNLGNSLQGRNQLEAALEWYAKALAKLQPVLAKEPRLTYARMAVSRSHIARALALHKLARYAEALKDWDRALEFDDGHQTNAIRNESAATLARLKAPVPAPLVAGKVVQGNLTNLDPLDSFPLTQKSHHRVHTALLEAGQPYLIDLKGDFDTFVRLEDAQKNTLLFNDDVRPDDLNSRLVFIPPQKDTYRLVVTSYKPGDTGSYTVNIQKALKVGKPDLVEDKL